MFLRDHLTNEMNKVILGTWSFSKEAVTTTRDALLSSQSSIDSIEKGINSIEENMKYGPCIVGVGGPRNSHGFLEMDAAVMNGRHLQFGAVTALKGFSKPISVARSVMERCTHSMLTADGARIFAEKEGFTFNPELASKDTNGELPFQCHDTLGLIVLDGDDISCGVSTSGMPNKHPGRVGDSALPGNGLYADVSGGAACCSGDGDFILKFCPAFQVVQLLKQGKKPKEACNIVISDMTNRCSEYFEISIIAVNMKGEYGAGTTVASWKDPLEKDKTFNGFPYVAWTSGMDEPVCLCQEIIT
ncbi:N4-(beta-N-acetylglucosaminyl)-L-asparaginase [Mytilus galloprovincialis]|uniref:N4-(Beta-N-acetylglucosaminyl)-L-asparaginase n=2 Tax=Mytilus galloprovincialis TaxID=29158 RepID=A0A8B6DW48_MYTGA|nr:N4-(beta-N-acetylglucosaminyl)-L-asparaginase [Mytilus galloprovincialis]